MSRATQYEMVSNKVVHNFTFLETMQICDAQLATEHDSASCQFCVETKYVVCGLLSSRYKQQCIQLIHVYIKVISLRLFIICRIQITQFTTSHFWRLCKFATHSLPPNTSLLVASFALKRSLSLADYYLPDINKIQFTWSKFN